MTRASSVAGGGATAEYGRKSIAFRLIAVAAVSKSQSGLGQSLKQNTPALSYGDGAPKRI